MKPYRKIEFTATRIKGGLTAGKTCYQGHLQHNAFLSAFFEAGGVFDRLVETTTAGRKPHIPRNATCLKADFSRVYFQNVRFGRGRTGQRTQRSPLQDAS